MPQYHLPNGKVVHTEKDIPPDQMDDFVSTMMGSDAQPAKESGIGEKVNQFVGEHPMLRRFLSGPSEEELGGVKILGKPDDTSLLPRMTHPADESNFGYLGRGVYNFLVRPLGSPEGLIGASQPGHIPSPEIAESTIAPTRLALPPARDVMIGGPTGNPLGQVAKSDVPPDVAARISGEAIPMKSTSPAHYGVDLDELRERTRLANTFFTQQEASGGSRLTIPDRPPISAPPVAGETKLGFQPTSQANLEYPLNIAPEVVRPRSVQETTRALAGSEMARPVTPKQGVEFESPEAPPQTIQEPGRNLAGGTAAIEPGETILPSAREIQATAKNVPGVLPDKLAEAAVYSPPPIANAVRQVIKEESSRPSMWKSLYSELKNQSQELYAKSFRAVHLERQYKANWVPNFQQAINKLSKTEKENFGGYVEGSIPVTSPSVRNAVDIWKQAEGSIGDEAQSVNLRMRVDDKSKAYIPFQKNPNYWPHMASENLSQTTMLDRLMNNGMTRFEANKVIAHWRRTGEIVVSPQHARDIGKVFPYRLDADAGLAHIRTMAKRIAQHREFGPLDISGKGSEGIADLIENTPNSKKTEKLMERILKRDGQDDNELMKVLNVARKYSTITKLQNFTLPNIILGQSSTALRASRYPMEALSELGQLFKRSYRDELRASGAWQDYAQSLMEEIKPGVDWFGIGAGETINRGVAGSVGRGVARGAFKELRANPDSKFARNELFELLGEKPETLLKQERLTPDQLRLAAGRMAERTQGLTVPGNLPHSWSAPVNDVWSLGGQTFLIFKKMGFMATKNMWESIKADPVRNIPLWLASAGVAGELVGDSKAFLRGIWKGDPASEIEDRGSYWLQSAGVPQSSIESVASLAGVDPLVVSRLFDNYMQSFFLGLPADLLMSSQYGTEGLLKAVAGPVAGDISQLANRTVRGDAKGIGKDVVSSLPIFGSRGAAESLFDEQ